MLSPEIIQRTSLREDVSSEIDSTPDLVLKKFIFLIQEAEGSHLVNEEKSKNFLRRKASNLCGFEVDDDKPKPVSSYRVAVTSFTYHSLSNFLKQLRLIKENTQMKEFLEMIQEAKEILIEGDKKERLYLDPTTFCELLAFFPKVEVLTLKYVVSGATVDDPYEFLCIPNFLKKINLSHVSGLFSFMLVNFSDLFFKLEYLMLKDVPVSSIQIMLALTKTKVLKQLSIGQMPHMSFDEIISLVSIQKNLEEVELDIEEIKGHQLSSLHRYLGDILVALTFRVQESSDLLMAFMLGHKDKFRKLEKFRVKLAEK